MCISSYLITGNELSHLFFEEIFPFQAFSSVRSIRLCLVVSNSGYVFFRSVRFSCSGLLCTVQRVVLK